MGLHIAKSLPCIYTITICFLPGCKDSHKTEMGQMAEKPEYLEHVNELYLKGIHIPIREIEEQLNIKFIEAEYLGIEYKNESIILGDDVDNYFDLLEEKAEAAQIEKEKIENERLNNKKESLITEREQFSLIKGFEQLNKE